MVDQLRVNDNLFSWGSVTVRLDDEVFTGITAINYGDARERVKGYGTGRHQAPRGRSRGKYTTEPVTATLHRDTVRDLRAAIASRATDGVSYGNVQFEIVVQYSEPGEEPMTDTLERCVWTKNTSSNEEGPDNLMVEVEFDCMQIKWNNLTLYDSNNTNAP